MNGILRTCLLPMICLWFTIFRRNLVMYLGKMIEKASSDKLFAHPSILIPRHFYQRYRFQAFITAENG